MQEEKIQTAPDLEKLTIPGERNPGRRTKIFSSQMNEKQVKLPMLAFLVTNQVIAYLFCSKYFSNRSSSKASFHTVTVFEFLYYELKNA